MINQVTVLCFKGGLYGLVAHLISLIFFSTIVNLTIARIGLSYFFNFLTNFIFLFHFYSNNNPNNILLPWSKEALTDWNGLLYQLKLGFYPFFNYIFFMGSLEAISGFGLLINDISFTVLTIYMNILSIIIVMSEAVGNTMSLLSAYFIGKRNGEMLKMVLKTSLGISTVIQLFFIGCLTIFPEQILSIYSTDIEFLKMGVENINYFAVVVSFNSYHFVPAEFIVVFGNQSIPLYAVVLGKYICQFGGALLLSGSMGLKGILISMIIGQGVCLLVFYLYITTYIDFNNFEAVNSIHLLDNHIDPTRGKDDEREMKRHDDETLEAADDSQAPVDLHFQLLKKKSELHPDDHAELS